MMRSSPDAGEPLAGLRSLAGAWCSDWCGLGYGFELAGRGGWLVEVAAADERQGSDGTGQGDDAADHEDLVGA